MDWHSFEKMSKSEAIQLLAEFLSDGKANIDIVRDHLRADGIDADYSLATLEGVLEWTLREMKVKRRDSEEDIPQWIRETLTHEKGRFDFDARSGNLLVFVAYYFGECFIRSFPHLRWATGNRKTLEANMPVVTGFGLGMELAPILVLENCLRRLIIEPDNQDRFSVMLKSWMQIANDPFAA